MNSARYTYTVSFFVCVPSLLPVCPVVIVTTRVKLFTVCGHKSCSKSYVNIPPNTSSSAANYLLLFIIIYSRIKLCALLFAFLRRQSDVHNLSDESTASFLQKLSRLSFCLTKTQRSTRKNNHKFYLIIPCVNPERSPRKVSYNNQ